MSMPAHSAPLGITFFNWKDLVVFVPFDDEGNPTSLPVDLLRHDGSTASRPDLVRPVDAQLTAVGGSL